MARRVKGGARIRALLKGLPSAFREEMTGALDRGGRALQAAMRARAPKRTGALAEGISYKVYPQTSRLKVGLLGTKRGRSSLFYGRIQDLGRKAQVVKVTRRANTKPYQMRVRGMAPKRFITGRFPELRENMRAELKGIFTRALARISGGGGG